MPGSAPFSRRRDGMSCHSEGTGIMGENETVGVPDGMSIEDQSHEATEHLKIRPSRELRYRYWIWG